MKNPLIHLCYPCYEPKLKRSGNDIYVFDDIRMKWLVCTPEEWVRQNLIKFLIIDCHFPKSLISVEKKLEIAGRDYRFDALIYDLNFNPLLIIECKAPSVKLTQIVFDQIWNYNLEIKAPFFLVTNGLDFVMGKFDRKFGVSFFDSPKTFEDLKDL